MRIVSADCHINEPPYTYDRVPAALKDRVPRIVTSPAGGQGWSYAGEVPHHTFGIEALAGRPLDGKLAGLRFDEIMPGNYEGAAHVADMDIDGVDVSVVFPNHATWLYSTDDVELSLACLRSYNGWILEDFQAADPARLVGLPLLPVDDLDATVAEIDRVMAMDARAAFIPANPRVPYHVESYDRLWAVAQERGLPLCIHRTAGGRPHEANWDELAKVSSTAAGTAYRFFGGVRPLTYLVFAGVFDRFPDLKLVLGEVNCGWLPFWGQTCDQQFENRFYKTTGRIVVKDPPSQVIGRNVFVTVLDDHVGFQMMASGLYPSMVDAVMFSSDYPHSVCLWPDTVRWAETLTGGLDEGARHKVLAGNAAAVFGV